MKYLVLVALVLMLVYLGSVLSLRRIFYDIDATRIGLVFVPFRFNFSKASEIHLTIADARVIHIFETDLRRWDFRVASHVAMNHMGCRAKENICG